ncbi:MAG: Cna B-type domain-containing protein, partial [Peptoanaerobacter stomatis]
MKVRNRILNIFLAVMLVFTTLLSTNKEVFADHSNHQPSAKLVVDSQNSGGDKIVANQDGSQKYKLTKKAEEKDGKVQITIGAEGGSEKKNELSNKNIDIVLIADTSGSMGKDQRITKLVNALNGQKGVFLSLKNLEEKLNLKNKIRVSFLEFNNDVSDLSQGFQNIDYFVNGQGKSEIEGLKEQVYLDYTVNHARATYTDKALEKTQEMIDSSNATDKIVILMSDGEPTYSTKIKLYNSTPPEFYNERVGTGGSYELPKKLFKKKGYKTDDGVRIKDNGQAGILRAKSLKNKATVYTVGIGSEGKLNEYLQKIASTDKFYSDTSNMADFADTLKAILYKEIMSPTINDETLTDIMGDKVKLSGETADNIKTSIENSIYVKAGTPDREKEIREAVERGLEVSNDKKTITLKGLKLGKDESFKITYEIEANLSNITEADYGKSFVANQKAGFKAVGEDNIFPQPKVKVIGTEKITLKASKKWVGVTNYQNLKATIQLYKEGNHVQGQDKEITGDGNTEFEVDKFDANNHEIQYELKEKEIDGYKSERVKNGNNYEFINKPVEPEKITLKASKKWVGVTNYQNLKATIQLYKEGNHVQGQDKEITGDGNTEFEVDKFDANNHEIQYELKEKEIDGYKSERVKNGNNYEFINKPVEPEKITLKASKKWVGVTNYQNLKATIQLYKEGNHVQGQDKEITGDGNTEFEVDKFDANNHEIQYELKEKEIDGYKSERVKNGNNYEFINKPVEPE